MPRRIGSKNDTCDCLAVHPDRIETSRLSMASRGAIEALAAFFKVVGDPTRLSILSALDSQELCVCDLCQVLSMSQSAVSHQLAELRKARLVRSRREGKTVFYSMDDEHVREIFRSGKAHLAEKGEWL